MPPVPDRPVVLGLEIGCGRIEEVERVPFVIVVRPVEAQRVVRVETQPPVERGIPAQSERDRVVAGAGAALGHGDGAQRARPLGEGRTEFRRVSVHEAEQVVRAGVLQRKRHRGVLAQRLLHGDVEGPGPRQFEVAVRDVHAGLEGRRARRGRRQELPDLRRRRKEGRVAGRELRALEGAVRRPVLREHEHRDPREVGPGVQADEGAPIVPWIPGEPEARLEVVEVVRNRPVRRETRGPDPWSVEGVPGLDEHPRVPRPFPAHAEVQGEVVARAPRVLDEEPEFAHREVLQAQLVGRGVPQREGLQVEEHGAGDRGPRRTDAFRAVGTVGAGDVPVPPRDEVHEAVDGGELVETVREADELLADRRPIVLDADLEQVIAREEGDVVDDLDPGVVARVDGEEEGHPEAKPVREVHRDVREGAAADRGEGRLRRRGGAWEQGSVVAPGPVLARVLEAELVGDGVGELRSEARVDRVGEVLLQAVGAETPGIHVERPVHLLGPGVVVLEGRLVAVAEVEIELRDERAVVVGAVDRAELIVEQAGPLRLKEALELLEFGPVHDVARELLRLVRFLLVVGNEEKRLVAHDRAAERKAELAAAELGLSAPSLARVGRGDRVPLAEIVRGARELVRARLRDDVHEASRGAPELRGRPLVHDDDFLDRVLVEGEGGPLAAPLLAEEGVVEVRSVHGNVVEDPPLSSDVENRAVRTLRDGDARREERVVEEVAAVVGQVVDDLLGEPVGTRRVLGVDERRPVRRHGDLGHRDGPEFEYEVDDLSHPEYEPLGALVAELAHDPGGDVVDPQRKERPHERSVGASHDGRDEAGRAMLDDHGGAGDGRSHGIADDPADDAGGRLGLRGRVRRGGAAQREHGEQKGGPASGDRNPAWPHG